MHDKAHPSLGISALGTPDFPSPLQEMYDEVDAKFLTEDDKVLFDDSLESLSFDRKTGTSGQRRSNICVKTFRM